MEVGHLEIGADINTEGLEDGFRIIDSKLDEVGARGKSVNSDFQRMANIGGKLSTILAGVGIVGAGSMLAIAKNSPATAASMAQIEVETGKLQRSLGQGLAPVFDLAADAFSGFVGIVQSNQGTISELSTLFSESIRESWNDAGTIFGFVAEKIKDLGEVVGINGESISEFLTQGTSGDIVDWTLTGLWSFNNPLGILADLIKELERKFSKKDIEMSGVDTS